MLRRLWFSTCPSLDPSKQLDQLYTLASRVNQTPSLLEKRRIVQEYPQCHSILQRIYDPHLRHHASSKHVLSFMQSQRPSTLSPSALPLSLEQLLDQLSSRTITGHAALETIACFYSRYCVAPQQQQVFWRVLDRNLKMGLSIKSIRLLLAPPPPSPRPADLLHATTVVQTTAVQPSSFSFDRRFMHVALASKTPANFEDLVCKEDQVGQWYASRKLDGVRCLAFVQWLPALTIQFSSRTGRLFDSLGKVEHSLRQQLQSNHTWHRQFPDGFVLDGEICVFASNSLSQTPLSSHHPSCKEDFLATLRQIRSKGGSMPHPMFELFDLVDLRIFQQGLGGPAFHDRSLALQALLSPDDHLHILDQYRITTKNQLTSLKEKVLDYGWEGLIVRKNVPYEGKRSRNMVKIKEWEDAEYEVMGIETGWMRLPNTGVEEKVLTSVLIHHKGHPVSVGSGFGLGQRLDYAKDPSLILGKTITVKYFSESMGDHGNVSLRFPIVKAVYTDQGRD
ncbi:DNA ligase/mRNA capping enzyme [Hesseltinella vesiculosa]|uniref:DNA ligase/mRNA capping enzyme n=1 Tax=Hesseltinella vesiculosa TaxID=101127 RepID=A0A1X2GB10_9FUNG|nr:DNA ligase/mRNA capping enzyme [Hesseltinella vesiculosa]